MPGVFTISEEADMRDLVKEREAVLSQINSLNEKLGKIDDNIFSLVQSRIRSEGSTTINHEGVKLTVTIPVRVSWDEAKLREVARLIASNGDDPENYIKFKPSVSERDFKAWPEAVQTVFLPARTIKPGKRKIEIKEVEN
jgi:hypothetical protein